jgi:sec-independent protein translocase protein TatA
MGFGEILIVLVVVLLVFGANKIPQLGDALGKGIRNFRKSAREDDSIDVTPERTDPQQLGGGPSQGGAQSHAGAEAKKA